MIRTFVMILVAAMVSMTFGQEALNERHEEDVLQRGLQSLMKLQSEDGAWHSQHYGSMKQGAALTTLVLYSVSHLPPEVREPYQNQIAAAFEFLKPGLQESGFVVNPEGSEDYPVYCTAMLLVASEKLQLQVTDATKNRMVDYLIQSQITETRGFESDHVEYGGWDVLGPNTRAGKTSGTNVSVTCYVVEALEGFKKRSDVQSSLQLAENWMNRIVEKSTDGGFFFTLKLDSMNNKASWADDELLEPKSYGTATCDGLRILHHCGVDHADDRFGAAVNWLAQQDEVKSVPGFGEEPNFQAWQLSLRFYYFSSLAKSLRWLPGESKEKVRAGLLDELSQLQQEDGLWQNEFDLMRENDPIIASSLAILAYGSLQSQNRDQASADASDSD